MNMYKLKNQEGQALVTLLVFVTIAIIVITSAVAVIISTSLSASRVEESISTLAIAESGAEESVKNLISNPHYFDSGTTKTLTVGLGTAKIELVSFDPATGNITIRSTGKTNSLTRTIEIVGKYKDKFNITSWREIN